LKENIQRLFGIAGLNVYAYNFKNRPGVLRIGMMAQEVYETYPEAVHVGGPDPLTNPWTIDYGKLSSLVIGIKPLLELILA
jgi:hypothetical protein